MWSGALCLWVLVFSSTEVSLGYTWYSACALALLRKVRAGLLFGFVPGTRKHDTMQPNVTVSVLRKVTHSQTSVHADFLGNAWGECTCGAFSLCLCRLVLEEIGWGIHPRVCAVLYDKIKLP